MSFEEAVLSGPLACADADDEHVPAHAPANDAHANDVHMPIDIVLATQDADGNGRLDSREVANALRRCNVALSADSLAALVARCSPSEGMTLDFAGFVRLVALVKQEGLTSNSGASDDICAVGERQE